MIRKYLFIPTSVTSSINFVEVIQNSIEELKLSTDGQSTYVSYISGSRPSIYSSEYNEYNLEQAYQELRNPNWNLGPEIDILHLDL